MTTKHRTNHHDDLVRALEGMTGTFGHLFASDITPAGKRRIGEGRMIGAATFAKDTLARVTGHPKYGDAGIGTPARTAWKERQPR